MSEYIETSEYHTAVAKAKRQASDAAKAINSFIWRHPEIRDVDANRSVIYQYYNGDLTDITAESLEECWSTHPRFKAMLACFPSEADERQTLESRILELLKSGTSAENLKSISAGFRYKSIEELRSKVQDLESRAQMRAKTTAELRAEIQNARPNPEQNLPEDVTREVILGLWGAEQFRFWARKVGMDAINRRINQKG